jgi:hypothetical protein
MSAYTVGQPARVLRDLGRHGTVLQPVTVVAVDDDRVTFRAADGWETTLSAGSLRDYALPGRNPA